MQALDGCHVFLSVAHCLCCPFARIILVLLELAHTPGAFTITWRRIIKSENLRSPVGIPICFMVLPFLYIA